MRTPILAVVALVFGLAAAYGTWHYISTSKPADPEHDVVVVKESLKTDIQPNEELNANMFEVKKMKQTQIGDPKENGLVIQGVAGRDLVALTTNKRRSKVKLTRGKPILFDLQTVEQGAFGIQSQLAEGETAYVVQTNQYKGGSGLLRPGMKVDVVVSFKDPNTGDPKVAVMFENVDVLAVNLYENTPPENAALIPDRAVLRMNYEQMLRLSYFENSCNATVSLNIRSGLTTKTIVGQQFDPKNERLFSPPKKEVARQDVPSTQGGNDSNPGSTPATVPTAPETPMGPNRKTIDKGITFYDGTTSKHIPNPVIIELPPTGVVKPPAPGIDKGGPGYQVQPEKKDDTKKDEPKKDDTKGGEAPKGGTGK
jgi:Flp pilus assembly protein CpaB